MWDYFSNQEFQGYYEIQAKIRRQNLLQYGETGPGVFLSRKKNSTDGLLRGSMEEFNAKNCKEDEIFMPNVLSQCFDPRKEIFLLYISKE